MTDEFEKNNAKNQKEIDDFFAQFDKISDNLNKTPSAGKKSSSADSSADSSGMRYERPRRNSSATSYTGFASSSEDEKKKAFIDRVAASSNESNSSPGLRIPGREGRNSTDRSSSARTESNYTGNFSDKTRNVGDLLGTGNSHVLNAASDTGKDFTGDAPKPTRMARLSENKAGKSPRLEGMIDKISGAPGAAGEVFKEKFMLSNEDEIDELEAETALGAAMGKKGKRRKRKKYKLNKKKVFLFLLAVIFVFAAVVIGFSASIIMNAPEIDPDNIYSLLSENSVLYDDQGNPIDSIFAGEGNRTNVEYADLPPQLVNAFIAIEDKTFWDHHGFNITRIFGAIKDSIVSGGQVSGTSTITQQLARNLYLTETRTQHSMQRKIAEAYYTVLLENALSKEQIIEAYLNTIYLGYESYGVQAASQAYFSKDVGELTTLECAALASLPKAPDSYALIKRLNPENVDPEDPNIIYVGNEFIYLFNDKSADRRNATLRNMFEQGYITEEEKATLMAEDFKSHINPSLESVTSFSTYFADYVIDQLINDLMNEYNYKYDDAKQKVYNGGLNIYTTLSSNMQKIAESEFSNNANFPKVANLRKDGNSNILNSNGNIMLYSYGNYFDESGNFNLHPEEYSRQSDGSLLLRKGKRLNFYKTEVGGNIDYSAEFKTMYTVEDGIFYSIAGGVLAIPAQYKTKTENGDLIIDASFFSDKPDAFISNGEYITIGPTHYTLRQKVVQPQGAMVITDYRTGGIKAMVGGRNTVGRLLFNRAISPRQPGSSIKPMAVYSSALQSGVEALSRGETQTFTDQSGNPITSYGDYWTAASMIEDAPMTFNGKQWPKNWYSGFRGWMSFRTSMEQSVNVNAVKVFLQQGPEYTARMLKKFGITSVVESGETNDMNAAALALGGMSHGIAPIEMAGGYGVFGNQGTYIQPVAYTKVENNRGELILEKIPESHDVIDPGVAFIMTDMLRTTVTNGIAGGAAIGVQPVAGKTGTTTDNFDAWFVGLTPQYAASVWIGNDVNIELSQGSVAAAKLWSKVMRQVCAGIPSASFPSAPSNVISASVGSSVAEDGTVQTRSEYFIKGTESGRGTADSYETTKEICADSGLLATPLCHNRITKTGTLKPYDDGSGNTLPYYYCNLHNPDSSVYAIPPGTQLDPNAASYSPVDGNTSDNNSGQQSQPSDQSGPSGQEPATEPQPSQSPVSQEDIYDNMPEWLRP
ncbi:MAG: transglycosylase domain-containing protein [Clostridia bacterium]|nr:transglycosylase domain-containing protein [Clostridia bacterium]